MRTGPDLRTSLQRLRRQLFERLGSDRYSRASLGNLDEAIRRHIGERPGFFVEAGANDGFEQSNTYILERFHGWDGLLVEAHPDLARACRLNRRVPVVEAALVGPDVAGSVVHLHDAGLMSTLDGALGGPEATRAHVEAGLRVQGLTSTRLIPVRAETLGSILKRHAPGRQVDLLVLDIEGGEAEALKGLDLATQPPRWICVEVRDREAIHKALGGRYVEQAILFEEASRADILFRLPKP